MELYLDTGNVDEIRRGVATGVVDGVTTNPSLIAKEGKNFEATVRAIVAVFKEAGKDGFTVSAEVLSDDADGMVKEAVQLARIDPHVIIKLPFTPEGIMAAGILAKRSIRTNLTLCFSANQALLAAKAGAAYVSPFVGRLDDKGEDGMRLVRDIRKVFDNYGFKTRIITASVRSEEHVLQAALAGSDIATIPPAIFWRLFSHPLTEAGIARFKEDWEKHLRR